MSLNSVILAVEDSLSDAVSTKILQYFGIEIHVRIPNTYQGNTYLRRRAAELNRSAKGPLYVFMFTDLDSPKRCAPELIQSWVKAPLNPGFFLRVAVMEIESWIMADRGALAAFLSIPVGRIPGTPDDILYPKDSWCPLPAEARRKACEISLFHREERQPQGSVPNITVAWGNLYGMIGTWNAPLRYRQA